MIAHKPFLTYQDQISLLKKKGLIISDDEYAIELLKKYGYFDLITGYKQPFKQKNGQYKLHTRIEDIVSLYTFDESLRALFLQYILKVEKHIKSLLTYVFCFHHGANEHNFFEPKSYSLLHNERLFTYQDKQSIPTTDIHYILNIPCSKGHFTKGKRDLFAVLIVLKYLLDIKDFSSLIQKSSSLINALSNDVYNIQLTQIYRYLGFPHDWEVLSSCQKQKNII